MPEFNLLDCTFRDGGYHTDWAFPDPLLMDWLDLCARMKLYGAEIGYLEIDTDLREADGRFRNLPASLTESQRKILMAPRNLRLGVMIDAKVLCRLDVDVAVQAVKQALKAFPVQIGILRIAATATELLHASQVAAALANDVAGPEVFVNLMRASSIKHDELETLVGDAMRDTQIGGLYIADSFGQMMPSDVRDMLQVLRRATDLPLGFHAHDNLGFGVANSVAAFEAGASYIDGTFAGLGRGAGNAPTESLAALADRGLSKDWPSQCEAFLASHIADLRAKHIWGSSPTYRAQALYGVHPTYAQNLCEATNMRDRDRLRYLALISGSGRQSSFDAAYFEEILERA